MPWNIDAAVQHLQTKAHINTQGRCARYVREAIEAGGVTLARADYAFAYGTSLVAAGFAEHASEPTGGYVKGDVAVIGTYTGNTAGHMQMYDGSVWISDFKQREFWPGPGYRQARPSFKIYRYPAATR
ncbi:MAG: hypothetical protein LBV45_00010 [Xanthomonadaceae bacterium]|jgi:hypothetical protein|nr:hypothetical protein [Xanthomonadaceae bacterium]